MRNVAKLLRLDDKGLPSNRLSQTFCELLILTLIQFFVPWISKIKKWSTICTLRHLRKQHQTIIANSLHIIRYIYIYTHRFSVRRASLFAQVRASLVQYSEHSTRMLHYRDTWEKHMRLQCSCRFNGEVDVPKDVWCMLPQVIAPSGSILWW